MDVPELIALQRTGARLKFVFFWREHGLTGCLSQWHASPFTVDGVRYATAEHYMMAEKARLFGDERAAAAVIAAPHPGRAKDLGRRVTGFDESTWREHRLDIVVRGNLAKFAQHDDLRAYLVGTRRRILAEASPRDRVWGIGLTADDPRAERPDAWRGENLLGRALMTVRDRLA
ncbi:NADAR family protein [Actinomadura algeriensis]|uniref:RibA/ribD-fused uncharacterized protein n=1 Tax=Actinomadura algeriensis TaxID=1679523 RepID=A0ABR9JK61_9ACTN|nr:NADAR family protein [Actinomadura algeriensis]MBE1530929.1 ribA/ribD-fused uncharacterized protein [Actinomadura algeriensis]